MALVKYSQLCFLMFILVSCSSNRDNENIRKLYDLYLNQNKKSEIVNITEEKIKHINYPVIEIRTNGILKQGVFLPMTSRNGYKNWTSGIGQIITMNGASITKTNGIDVYLNSLEIQDINPFNNKINLKDWPETVKKIYRFVEPSFEEKIITVVCELIKEKKEQILILQRKYNFYKIIEKCDSKNYNFVNYYWANSSGFIWQSYQWISPKDVYANVHVLKK